MADFGEALPLEARLFSGERAEYYHNRYPEEWARINREAIDEAGAEEIVFSAAQVIPGARLMPLYSGWGTRW